jgi:hypothetical protein
MRLLYFAPVPWDSYEQRPHYFARHFLALGGAVLWINPYPSRLPRWQDLGRLRRRDNALTLPRPRDLTVVDTNGWPIDPLPAGSWLNDRFFWRRMLDRLTPYSGRDTVLGIGRPTAMALTALGRVTHAWSFYDAMDDFPEFYRGLSQRATTAVEQEIARSVNRIFASSSHLTAKFTASGRDVRRVTNAYDMALLPAVSGARATRHGLGFIGAIAGWFDWSLLSRVADAVRPMPVTLVGPRFSRLPSRLPPNVRHRPQVHQREGVEWLQTISAGLIPFVKTPLTAGIDPIKYYQYRGAGLPVLTSTFGEMAQRSEIDATFALDGPAGPRAAVDAALAWHPDPAAIERFRNENTWTRRFEDARIYEAP